MQFFLSTPFEVDYGNTPEGATIVDGERPFFRRTLTAAALAAVLRLHTEWYSSRWASVVVGRRADLTDADLTGADLTDADLTDADLTGAVLTDADLTGAVLTRADLTDADLTDADLTGADLTRAVLTGAVLTRAVLTRADLTGAVLTRAVLTRADLTRADLTGAVLTRAVLTGAVGLVTPEEEEATLNAAVEAIAREPQHWQQDLWHSPGFRPDAAPNVGACGTSHCLAGWMQVMLPLDHAYRKLSAYDAGVRLAPRVAAAGWFGGLAHPDLMARVEAAKAKVEAEKAAKDTP